MYLLKLVVVVASERVESPQLVPATTQLGRTISSEATYVSANL